MILSPVESVIKAKIEAIGLPLKDWNINIYRGILTGYNEAFIIDQETRDKLIAASPKNAEIIRPILMGRNIKKYEFNWENLYLINTHNGLKEKGIPPVNVQSDFPEIFTYLSQFKDSLEKRLDKGSEWTNLRNCAYLDDFDKPKIAWGNLALNGQFCLVPPNFMINAPSPFFATEDLYILGLLNSKLADYYLKQLGVSRSGGYMEYKPMFVGQFPIVVADNVTNEIITHKVKLLLKAETNKEKDLIEQEIDEIVLSLYEITADEKELIYKSAFMIKSISSSENSNKL